MLNSEKAIHEFEDDGEWEDCDDDDIWGNYREEDGEMPALEDGDNGVHYLPPLSKLRYYFFVVYLKAYFHYSIDFMFAESQNTDLDVILMQMHLTQTVCMLFFTNGILNPKY